jgi:predicted helicase
MSQVVIQQYLNQLQDLRKDKAIVFTDPTSQKPFMALATVACPDMHLVGAAAGALTLGFEALEGRRRSANVTDWAVGQFRSHCERGREKKDGPITKEEIFHYVYAVLHNPLYREKYALNLKREFPRIPLYNDFWQWAEWGRVELYLNRVTIAARGAAFSLPPKRSFRNATLSPGSETLEIHWRFSGIHKEMII